MNNRGIICQNNIMIIFLFLFIIFILILLNKKVRISIDFSVNGLEYNFCININYFFDILTLYKEDFARLKKKTKKRLKKKKTYFPKWIFKRLDINRINLDIGVGLGDVFVTTMSVPIVSTCVSILMRKYLSKSTKKFSVKPIYNKLFVTAKGSIEASVKLKDVIYMIFRIFKESKKLE